MITKKKLRSLGLQPPIAPVTEDERMSKDLRQYITAKQAAGELGAITNHCFSSSD